MVFCPPLLFRHICHLVADAPRGVILIGMGSFFFVLPLPVYLVVFVIVGTTRQAN